MALSDELIWRGQIKDKTFEDIKWLNTPRTFYLGADCSAPSLTIGNLAVFMLARRLKDAGWNAILLVGGATSLIGDPGGKDSERDLKSREEVEKNVAAIKKQVQRLFAGEKFTLVDNYDWFQDIKYLDFLREVGKHFSMTELVQRDYIAERMGEGGNGISYAEFSYSLIQGYDFWHLYKSYDVVLQIGGSDQWGNMLSGVPLIRKKENAEAHALSAPLVINRATGKKFGKSEEGAVWLDENMTSVYSFYQFWLNADDEGVIDYLKIYTLLTKEEIEHIAQEFENNRAARLAQKTLAYETTKLVHGKDKADSVKRVTEVLFGSGDYESLGKADLELLEKQLRTIEVPKNSSLIAAAVECGLAASNGEARRFLVSGAFYINGAQIAADKMTFETADTITGNRIILRRGKNQQAVVILK